MKVHFSIPIAAIVVGYFLGYHTGVRDLGHILRAMFG